MRNLRKVTFFGMAIIIATFISCNKNDQDNMNEEMIELSTDIFGTYSGMLTTESIDKVTDATLKATKIDSQTVEIHCYGEELDTTFMMYMYEHGDSTMLCYTDSMFMMEYGHQISNQHHGMGGMMGDSTMSNNGMMYWNHHMDEEHDSTDMHYGGFNMMNQSCDYTIIIHDGDNEILKRFQGTK